MKTIFLIFSLFAIVGNYGYSQNLIVADSEQEQEIYPWSEEITQTAIAAIKQSINNLKLPKSKRDKNFPADPGPYNVPFSQTKIEVFEIVGYNKINGTDLYNISFMEEGIKCCANRIVVEINIKTAEVCKVFMMADG
ncbi:MAG: hypothetical protein ABJ092_13005 [Gillisia sp.]